MGPAKLMEVSLEGDFKDFITRKRWLGIIWHFSSCEKSGDPEQCLISSPNYFSYAPDFPTLFFPRIYFWSISSFPFSAVE